MIICIFLLVKEVQHKQTNFQYASGANKAKNETQYQFLQLFGQTDATQTSIHYLDQYGIYHAAGIVVDRSSTPNNVYVVDAGNNRILGYHGVGYCSNAPTKSCTLSSDCGGAACTVNGTKAPDIIIGQPDARHGACNGDNSVGINTSPTASTLCLLGYPNYVNNVSEEHDRIILDVDSAGNLYMIDRWNNRVLEYNQPLSTNKTNGNGDAIADFEWGQKDFTSNGNNRGSYYGNPPAPSSDTLFVSHDPTSLNTNVSARGVSVDLHNNVWVADTFNNRVLRFPGKVSNADLVIGQPNFTTTGCHETTINPTTSNLNVFCHPTEAAIRPDTGQLYVLDEYDPRYSARILVFNPPFSNGMSASRVIIPNQTYVTNPNNPNGPKVAFTNWPQGFDGKGGYLFQSWGFTYNPFYKPGIDNGVLWINENETHRTILLDDQNNIISVIGAPNENNIGGDNGEYSGSCGSIATGFRINSQGGGIGIDSGNNLYLADEWFHRIARYALPYAFQSNGCPPEPNGGLYPGVDADVVPEDKTGVLGPLIQNEPLDNSLGEQLGMAIYHNSQLIVSDLETNYNGRLKFWNNYLSKTIGAPPDGVIADDQNFTIPGNLHINNAIDDQNHLWIFNNSGQIRIYQLPLTPNETPLVDNVTLNWSDTNSPIMYSGDGVNPSSIAFDPIDKAIYVGDKTNSRILRISNYQNVSNTMTVDMVIGQPNKTTIACNHNQTMPWEASGNPSADSLCEPNDLTFDKFGNLYVVDNAYECHGNDRITTFMEQDLKNAHSLFPNLQAKLAFVGTLTTKGPCIPGAYTYTNEPGSPISVAFDSQNHMIIANDGYYGDIATRPIHQLWYYANPLSKQTPDGYIQVTMGAPGELVFDSQDNLYIQDHSFYRIWGINLTKDPQWLQLFSNITPTPPTPSPSITQPTSPPSPTPSPLSTPTPTPTATPTPYPSGISYCGAHCILNSDCDQSGETCGLCDPQAQICTTASVTPTQPITPTQSPIPTSTLSPTPQVSPTSFPSVSILPTPTPGSVTGMLSVHFEGIDPQNNASPDHPQRTVILSFYASQNFTQPSIASMQTTVSFLSTDPNGTFINSSIDLSSIPQGYYYVLAKSPEGSLQVLLSPNLINITAGSSISLNGTTPANLPMGDLNNDNAIDLADYNILVDCFKMKETSPGCSAHTITDHYLPNFADINDDGVVNGIDYNILIRNFELKGI